MVILAILVLFITVVIIINGVYNVYFQTEDKGWGDE